MGIANTKLYKKFRRKKKLPQTASRDGLAGKNLNPGRFTARSG